MQKSTFDIQLFIAFLIVMVVGVAFVYSASYPSALASFNDDQKILTRQLIAIGIGAFFMGAARITPLHWLRKNAHSLMFVGYIALVAVLLLGSSRGGNQAWLFGIQPSEFAKVFLINVLAASIAAHPGIIRGNINWKSLLTSKPVLYFGITLMLVGFQKDFGTVIIIALAGGMLLVLSGMKFRYVGVPVAFAVSMVVIIMMASPAAVQKIGGQRAARVIAWLHPFDAKMPKEIISVAYQPQNSLIAIGSGQLFGVGFCQSRQKWLYLPEPQNDYIFSIMSEELGLLFLIPLFFIPYLWMLFRGYTIAKNSRDEYRSTLAFGCTLLLATQASINIAVAMNLLPCMGVTLPLISSGGSSIISSMVLIGLLLNVSAPLRDVDQDKIVTE